MIQENYKGDASPGFGARRGLLLSLVDYEVQRFFSSDQTFLFLVVLLE
jgi:hypothetical protein